MSDTRCSQHMLLWSRHDFGVSHLRSNQAFVLEFIIYQIQIAML
jgi:hypothetical protein